MEPTTASSTSMSSSSLSLPPLVVSRSASNEWNDQISAQQQMAQTKERITNNVRAGMIRKVSYHSGDVTGDERSQPIIKKRQMEASPSHLEENANRQRAARAADGLMMAEQMRRIAETASMRSIAAHLEADERKKAIARVLALEEGERLHRIQDHTALTVEAETERTEGERSRAKALSLTTAEQSRRIADMAALKHDAKLEEAMERSLALAQVRAAEETERARRIFEREGDVSIKDVILQEKHERKKSIDLAWLLGEQERARRLAEENVEGDTDEVETREQLINWVEHEVERERGRRESMSWGERPAGLIAALRPL